MDAHTEPSPDEFDERRTFMVPGAFVDPFEGLPVHERARAARAALAYWRQQGTEALRELQDLVLQHDPLALLSMLSFYELLRPVDEQDTGPVSQPAVEVVQALVLRHSRGAFTPSPVLPEDYTSIRGAAGKLSTALAVGAVPPEDNGLADLGLGRVGLAAAFRSHTQAVRNSAYPQHTLRLVHGLFGPLDDDIEAAIGVRACALLEMLVAIEQGTEDALRAHTAGLRQIWHASSIDDAIDAHTRLLPACAKGGEGCPERVRREGWSLPQVRSMLVSHADLWLPDLLTFDLDRALRLYTQPAPREALSAVLQQWSMRFGDLSGLDPAEIPLANPVWAKPIIQLDGGRFFWPAVGMVWGFALDMLERLIGPYPQVMARYRRQRAEWLEQEAYALFRLAFPSGQVYHGVKWYGPEEGTEREADVLVVFDRHVVLAEAKSGRVPDSARRGGELRIEATANKLVVEPSHQATRLAQHLRTHPIAHEFRSRKGDPLHVDTSGVRRILRFAITLDHLGPLGYGTHALREAGFADDETPLVPCASIGEWWAVFEILSTEAERLHYLLRRSEFATQARYVGDELDVLALYLETALNIGEGTAQGMVLALVGLSRRLDPFFVGSYMGESPPKPTRQYTQWWTDILGRLASKAPVGWAETACVLLDAGREEQEAVEEGIQRAMRAGRCYGETTPDHARHVILLPGPAHGAIVGFPYVNLGRAQRDDLVRAAAGQAIEESGVDQVVVIAVDVGRASYPYAMLAGVGPNLTGPPSVDEVAIV